MRRSTVTTRSLVSVLSAASGARTGDKADCEATITFVPIRPGCVELHIPGTTAASQRAIFEIKG